MEWITPKTDWVKSDKITPTDYNRIRNNLMYLNSLFNEKYPEKAEQIDFGEEITVSDHYLPSKFNTFEYALQSFTRIGANLNVGESKTYSGNVPFVDANDLNRIEKCCLRWKEAQPHITSVIISPDVFELRNGETQQISLQVEPDGISYTVEWTSSNSSIMTVTQTGLVTAVAHGSATITATIKQAGYSDIVRTSSGISIIPIQSIAITPTETQYFTKGTQKTYNVAVSPNNATYKNDWELSGNGVKVSATKNSNTTFICEGNGHIPSTQSYGQSSDVRFYKRDEEYVDAFQVGDPNTFGLWSNWVQANSVASGSYKELNSTQNVYHGFTLIGKGLDGNTIATLMCYTMYGEIEGTWDISAKESSSSFRTALDTWVTSSELSIEMQAALQSVSKVVMNGLNATTTLTKKAFLLATNEVGISDPRVSKTLGTVVYPYVRDNALTELTSGEILTRSLINNAGDAEYTTISGINTTTKTSETWGSISQGLTFALDPEIFMLLTVKVKAIPAHSGFYEIDWTGTSSTTLNDIPLGSHVIDRTGRRVLS